MHAAQSSRVDQRCSNYLSTRSRRELSASWKRSRNFGRAKCYPEIEISDYSNSSANIPVSSNTAMDLDTTVRSDSYISDINEGQPSGWDQPEGHEEDEGSDVEEWYTAGQGTSFNGDLHFSDDVHSSHATPTDRQCNTTSITPASRLKLELEKLDALKKLTPVLGESPVILADHLRTKSEATLRKWNYDRSGVRKVHFDRQTQHNNSSSQNSFLSDSGFHDDDHVHWENSLEEILGPPEGTSTPPAPVQLSRSNYLEHAAQLDGALDASVRSITKPNQSWTRSCVLPQIVFDEVFYSSTASNTETDDDQMDDLMHDSELFLQEEVHSPSPESLKTRQNQYPKPSKSRKSVKYVKDQTNLSPSGPGSVEDILAKVHEWGGRSQSLPADVPLIGINDQEAFVEELSGRFAAANLSYVDPRHFWNDSEFPRCVSIITAAVKGLEESKGAQTHPIDPIDTVATIDAVATTDTADTIDTVDTVDTIDMIDTIDTVDTIDTADTKLDVDCDPQIKSLPASSENGSSTSTKLPTTRRKGNVAQKIMMFSAMAEAKVSSTSDDTRNVTRSSSIPLPPITTPEVEHFPDFEVDETPSERDLLRDGRIVGIEDVQDMSSSSHHDDFFMDNWQIDTSSQPYPPTNNALVKAGMITILPTIFEDALTHQNDTDPVQMPITISKEVDKKSRLMEAIETPLPAVTENETHDLLNEERAGFGLPLSVGLLVSGATSYLAQWGMPSGVVLTELIG
jgi:hypothetical protein